MSMIIEADDQELWSPSLRVGSLFLAQLRALEAILELPSGLAESLPDTIELHTGELRYFVDVLLHEIDATNNGAFVELAWGCSKILVALLARATGEWPNAGARAQVLIEEARQVFMPMTA